MKSSTKKTFLFILVVALLLYFVKFSPLSIGVNPPTCSFQPGTPCTFLTYTLPADRELTSFYVPLSFGSVPGTSYGEATALSPIATDHSTYAASSGNRDYSHYLYAMPSSWSDIYDIKLDVTETATAECWQSDSEQVYMYTRYTTNPKTDNAIVCSNGNSAYCPSNYLVWWGANGDRITTFINTGGGTANLITSCASSSGYKQNTNTATYTTTIPNQYVFNGTGAKALVSVAGIQASGSGAAITNAPVVNASYRKNNYPADLSYYVNGKYVATMSGVQKADTNTLDIADQINNACGRNTGNGNACTVTLTMTSSQEGLLWTGNAFEVEKIYTPTAPTTPPPATVVNETTGTTNNPAPVASTNTDFLSQIIEFVKNLLRGIGINV